MRRPYVPAPVRRTEWVPPTRARVRALRDRLRLHAALDLDRVLLDPARAQDVLGAELAHWLGTADRDGTPPTAAQLSAVLTALEAL